MTTLPDALALLADWDAGNPGDRDRYSRTVDLYDAAINFLREQGRTLATQQGEAVVSPEARFEQYVQTGIANSPEPVRELGEYLTNVLDEDQWPRAEALLLQLATRTGFALKLPLTGPYVDRIIRIFRDRPDDDTSALVLTDYADAAIRGEP